ncbi:MAG: YCF48-related protein [Patescibacteria group bacterium]|nr:YCF48-related protein [Patescibacteria group bacterium]MDD5490386.1 YCF48-related protein [Patescibacteria group bacterium]
MSSKKFFLLFSVLTIFVLSGAGCISFKKSGNDLGVFRSGDKGDNWQQKVSVAHVGVADVSIAGVNIKDFEIDPSDSNALYALSEGQGIIYTYDNGDSWQLVKFFSGKTINSIAVDNKDKCNLYAAVDNKIFKSDDCNRTWKLIYDDPRADNKINALDLDSFNTQIVYAGSSQGDVLKSLDGGKSWKAINRLKSSVEKILINQANDTRVVFVATQKNGVYKTANAGESWEESQDILRTYGGGLEFRDMVYQKNSLILATKYGLLKTTLGNEWQAWQPINLITAPGTATIYSLSVNPQNSAEIYYVADKTFYRTADGGKTWTTKALPTTGAGTALLVNYANPNMLYLGITKIKK